MYKLHVILFEHLKAQNFIKILLLINAFGETTTLKTCIIIIPSVYFVYLFVKKRS